MSVITDNFIPTLTLLGYNSKANCMVTINAEDTHNYTTQTHTHTDTHL